MPVSLTNVLEETVQSIHFIKSRSLSTRICKMSHRTQWALGLHTEVQFCLKNKQLWIIWIANWTWCFFHRSNYSYLKDWLVNYAYLDMNVERPFCEKQINRACRSSESSWQYLLPELKFDPLRKNGSVGKLCPPLQTWWLPDPLKAFLWSQLCY